MFGSTESNLISGVRRVDKKVCLLIRETTVNYNQLTLMVSHEWRILLGGASIRLDDTVSLESPITTGNDITGSSFSTGQTPQLAIFA